MLCDSMRCPECEQTLDAVAGFYNSDYVCEACEYVLPRGAD